MDSSQQKSDLQPLRFSLGMTERESWDFSRSSFGLVPQHLLECAEENPLFLVDDRKKEVIVPSCVPSAAVAKFLGSSVGSVCESGDGDLDVTQTEVVLDKEDLVGLNVDFSETEDEAFDDDGRVDSLADCSTIDRFHDYCDTSLQEEKNLSKGIKSAIESSVNCMLFDSDECQAIPYVDPKSFQLQAQLRNELVEHCEEIQNHESSFGDHNLSVVKADLLDSCYYAVQGLSESQSCFQELNDPFASSMTICNSVRDSTLNVVKTSLVKEALNGDSDRFVDLAYLQPLASLIGDASFVYGEEVQAEFLNADEDFISGVDCIEMLTQDQKKFEKEREAGEILGFFDYSWRSSCISDGDKSLAYERTSIGQCMAANSGPMGSLEGHKHIRRPSFGMIIKTPPNDRRPVVLLELSKNSNSSTNSGEASTKGGEYEDPKPHSANENADETMTAADLNSSGSSTYGSCHTSIGTCSESAQAAQRISPASTVIAQSLPLGKLAADPEPQSRVDDIVSHEEPFQISNTVCRSSSLLDTSLAIRHFTSALSKSRPKDEVKRLIKLFSNSSVINMNVVSSENSALMSSVFEPCASDSVGDTVAAKNDTICRQSVSDENGNEKCLVSESVELTTVSRANRVSLDTVLASSIKSYSWSSSLPNDSKVEVTASKPADESVSVTAPNMREKRTDGQSMDKTVPKQETPSSVLDSRESVLNGVHRSGAFKDVSARAVTSKISKTVVSSTGGDPLPIPRRTRISNLSILEEQSMSESNDGRPSTFYRATGAFNSPRRSSIVRHSKHPDLLNNWDLSRSCFDHSTFLFSSTFQSLDETAEEHMQSAVALVDESSDERQPVTSGSQRLPLFHQITPQAQVALCERGNPGRPSSHSTPLAQKPQCIGASAAVCIVEVPKELIVSNGCCVGMSASNNLLVRNCSKSNIEIRLNVGPVTVNGRQLEYYSPFSMQSVNINLASGADQLLKVQFLPMMIGAHISQLSVLALPASYDSSVAPASFQTAVLLKALANQPSVQVSNGQDFGTMTWSSHRLVSCEIENATESLVPVHLKIAMKPGSAGQFRFVVHEAGTMPSLTATSNEYKCSLSPAIVTSTGITLSTHRIGVQFLAPKAPDRPGEFLKCEASIEMLLNVNDRPPVRLCSLPVNAVVGDARLRTNTEVINFVCRPGQDNEFSVCLLNAGQVWFGVSLEMAGYQNMFNVSPAVCTLHPGEQSTVRVTFNTPKYARTAIYESVLMMYVEPEGPNFEIPVVGQLSLPLLPSLPSERVPELDLECDKSRVSFGGIELGKSAEQFLKLRNSSIRTLKVFLEIKNSTDYQFIMSFVNKEIRFTSKELSLKSLEEQVLQVRFTPSAYACIESNIVITSNAIDRKMTIPLTGYGGCSRIVIDNIPSLANEDRVHFQELRATSNSRKLQTVVTIRNDGKRTAYVVAVPFEDLECRRLMAEHVIDIQPSHQCIKPNCRKNVSITLKPDAMCDPSYQAVISFFYGDELCRQKYRRALRCGVIQPVVMPVDNPLSTNNFCATFQEEDPRDEGASSAVLSADNGLEFHSNKKSVLLVVRVGHNSQLAIEPEMRSSSPPVKESAVAMQTSLKSTSAHSQTSTVTTDLTMPITVDPDFFLLSSGQRGNFNIFNNSDAQVHFDLAWSGYSLSVTPKCGIIAPRGSIKVQFKVKLCTVKMPWDGYIHVHCNQTIVKSVRVKIEEQYGRNLSAGVKAASVQQDKEKRPVLSFPSTAVDETSTLSYVVSNVQSRSIGWQIAFVSSTYLQVTFRFRPTEDGLYVQHVNIEVVDGPSLAQLELAGQGYKLAEKKANSMTTAAISLNNDKKRTSSADRSSPSSHQQVVVVSPDRLEFPASEMERWTVTTASINNHGKSEVQVKVAPVQKPFFVNCSRFSLPGRCMLNLPIECRPAVAGDYRETLKLVIGGETFNIELSANFA